MRQALVLNNYYPNIPISNHIQQIYMIDRPTTYLLTSILLETFSTCCLKNTLNNKIWSFTSLYWLWYIVLYFP